MWKPRSVHEVEEGRVTAAGAGIFGPLRAFGADTWNRRFVAIAEGSSGRVLSYGRSPGNVEKSIPLSEIRAVTALSVFQMQQLKAPLQHHEHGWRMSFEEKDVHWACESAEIRNQWVSYLASLAKGSDGGRKRGESRLSALAQRFSSGAEANDSSTPRLEDCHCVVKCDDPDTLSIFLKRTRDGVKLEQVWRGWSECGEAAKIVRSLAPKVDLPSLNVAGMSLMQVRQRYVQSICDVIVNSPSLSHIPELSQFVGFVSYMDRHTHYVRGDTTAEASPKMGASPTDSSRPASPVEAVVTRHPSIVRPHHHLHPPTPTDHPSGGRPAPTSPKELRKEIDGIFKLLDEAGSGYLIAEDVDAFMRLIIPGSPSAAAQREIDDCKKAADNTFNPKAFADLLGRVSKASKVTLPELFARFSRSWLVSIYSSIGSDLSDSRFDSSELCVLKYVSAVAGLRVVNGSEVRRYHSGGEGFTLTLDDFLVVMNQLLTVVTIDRLVDSLRVSRSSGEFDFSQSKVLRLVNEAATSERAHSAAKAIKELLGAAADSGGIKEPTECLKCAATEARLRSTREEVAEMAEENQALTADLLDAEAELDAAHTQIDRQALTSQTLSNEIEYLTEELERSRSREHGLAERLLAAEQEIKRLQGKRDEEAAADEGDIMRKATLYFLAPMSFGGSAAAPVVDLPGNIVYNLPADFRPGGLAMDVLLTGVTGNEYLSCRDAVGRRSMHWSLSSPSCRLSIVGSQFQPALASNQWCRIQARIDWQRSTFDVYINGTLAMAHVSFRDQGVDSIAVLDIYPRKDVVVCYSNMNFFK